MASNLANPVQLPRALVSFIRTHVDHLGKLQFLLLLHGSPTGQTSIMAVARILDISRAQARDMANELATDELVRVASDHIVEFVPSSIDDRLAVAELAHWYARDRTCVHELLRALGRLA